MHLSIHNDALTKLAIDGPILTKTPNNPAVEHLLVVYEDFAYSSLAMGRIAWLHDLKQQSND